MRHTTLLIALVAAMPLAAQTVPRKQIVEEVRLDATDEDFPDVGFVLVSRRGEMAVMVSKDQQFRFYDATGKKLGTLGRVGSGPGEFRRVTFAGWTGDTLWVYDSELQRVTYISPDHKLLRSEVLSESVNQMMRAPVGAPGERSAPPPPQDGAIMLFSPRAIAGGKYIGSAVVAAGKTPDGRQDSKSKIMAIPRAVAAPVAPERGGSLRPATDSIGAAARTVLADAPSTNESFMRWSQADGRASAQSIVPFTFAPSTMYSSDGGRIGFLSVEPNETGGTYTLKVMKTSGEPVFTRAYPYVGVPIPRHVADSVIERIGVQSNGRQIFNPAAVAQFRDEAKRRMPRFYQPVSMLHMNRDNTAWIQMRRPDAQSAAAVVLVDERGNQVATFDLPPRTRIVQATRDQIWAVVTDEDDLPSVVRYRIR